MEPLRQPENQAAVASGTTPTPEALRPPPKPVQKILYTRREAAELLSIAVSTLDVCIARGWLQVRRIGRRRLIPHTALVAFSQKNLPAMWMENGKGKKNQSRPPGHGKQLPLFEAS